MLLIACSVGWEISLHCICFKREDVYFFIFIWMGEAPHCIVRRRWESPKGILFTNRNALHCICWNRKNLPIIFSLRGKDLDHCMFVRRRGFPNWLFFLRREYSSCIFPRREDPPIEFSLAGEHLPTAFSLGRENHSIALSVGGKMLTAASLDCICSRKEDAPHCNFCRMREISPG